VADAAASKVTVSYRSDAFSRAKLRNRKLVESASATGKIDIQLQSNVVEIAPRHVVLDAAERAAKIANDQVIVCAGGVLPTDFLRRAGIHIETKYGTE
jgi:thioredoxin reductase